jgi:hypothetical protein
MSKDLLETLNHIEHMMGKRKTFRNFSIMSRQNIFGISQNLRQVPTHCPSVLCCSRNTSHTNTCSLNNVSAMFDEFVSNPKMIQIQNGNFHGERNHDDKPLGSENWFTNQDTSLGKHGTEAKEQDQDYKVTSKVSLRFNLFTFLCGWKHWNPQIFSRISHDSPRLAWAAAHMSLAHAVGHLWDPHGEDAVVTKDYGRTMWENVGNTIEMFFPKQ